ncbi:hypothetical protein [Streptomyces lonegramiae]|uniref:SpdD protein n=1 Tax=Streptomyces lonegramiae TaxID=3075524 RepID=A0ABU2XSS7_9ACTN|nr:hypothetical protein [Streptomyces sp. DSM 41529]MDT0548621.1 hypothetical protein [Streptomyces sp. DSM 41529]
MFRPKFPEAPALPSTHVISPSVPAVQHGQAPACSCQHIAPTPAPAHRMVPGFSGGTVAAVVTVGIVLTALLAAIAVTAISVAVAAVVMRSLLTNQRRR